MSELGNTVQSKTSNPVVVRSLTDVQRLKLEKLMKNPDKPVIIPEKPKERGIPTVPDFVRNVMGSSAGAGSGEFHVYRHLRRKEYARQRYMKATAEREKLDNDYREKLEANKMLADEKTAKKRAKRLRKKKNNQRGKKKKIDETTKSDSEKSSEDESDSKPESNEDTLHKADELQEQDLNSKEVNINNAKTEGEEELSKVCDTQENNELSNETN